MMDYAKWITLIPISCTAISAILAVIVYIRQQRINRLQNLVSVFQRFSDNDDFLEIFEASDRCSAMLDVENQQVEAEAEIAKLAAIESKRKYKYLALLEEVAIFAKSSAIVDKNAIHLFQYHFYYVYGNHTVSDAFWQNVGSGIDEKNKEGWSYQNDFAKKCIAQIEG